MIGLTQKKESKTGYKKKIKWKVDENAAKPR